MFLKDDTVKKNKDKHPTKGCFSNFSFTCSIHFPLHVTFSFKAHETIPFTSIFDFIQVSCSIRLSSSINDSFIDK